MDLAQAVGSPLSLWWDGFEYKFSELTDGVKGDYVAWLKSRATASPYEIQADLKKLDGSLDVQRFAETKAIIANNITSLQYDWGGSLCSSSLSGLPGQVKLLHLAHAASGGTASIEEIEALVLVKNAEAVRLGLPVEQSEIATFLDRLQEESFPKSREVWLRKRAASLATN